MLICEWNMMKQLFNSKYEIAHYQFPFVDSFRQNVDGKNIYNTFIRHQRFTYLICDSTFIQYDAPHYSKRSHINNHFSSCSTNFLSVMKMKIYVQLNAFPSLFLGFDEKLCRRKCDAGETFYIVERDKTALLFLRESFPRFSQHLTQDYRFETNNPSTCLIFTKL